eukprot:95198-Chlamydomonas_euryale.AAC.6
MLHVMSAHRLLASLRACGVKAAFRPKQRCGGCVWQCACGHDAGVTRLVARATLVACLPACHRRLSEWMLKWRVD